MKSTEQILYGVKVIQILNVPQQQMCFITKKINIAIIFRAEQNLDLFEMMKMHAYIGYIIFKGDEGSRFTKIIQIIFAITTNKVESRDVRWGDIVLYKSDCSNFEIECGCGSNIFAFLYRTECEKNEIKKKDETNHAFDCFKLHNCCDDSFFSRT